MSLILEALKKSEARRQLGATPGLGTPFTVARRRRSALPLIGLLILAAAGLGWWFLRPSSSPAPVATGGTTTAPANRDAGPRATAVAAPQRTLATTSASATPAPAASNTVAAPAPAAPSNAPVVRPHDVSEVPRPPGMTAPTTHPDAFAAAREARRNAFARETAAVRAADAAAAVPAPVHPAARSETTAAHPGAVAAQSPTPAVPTAQARSHSDPAPASAPPQHASAPAPTATPPAMAVVPPGTVKPEPPAAPSAPTEHLPMYYELAYDVRKDLPPLVVSMHVFGKDPAQRFVVVDGERKVEGEAIKDGLTLREIHNDGMVLEFRGQRFFYPRPGR